MIDVLIPTIENDLPMLDKCIDGVRENVADGIREIFVISKDSEVIKDFCARKNVSYVNEIDLVGFGKDDFDIGNKVRNGWLYQQFIKLSGDKICSTDNFLVIDADHVLLKPHVFYDGKYHFYMTDEFHKPYFDCIQKLFNGKYKKIVDKSFISDKMIFNKEILKSMKEEIEKTTNKGFLESIIDNYSRYSFCGFSEFETYGTYVYEKFRDLIVLDDEIRYMSMSKEIEGMPLSEMKERYKDFMSITENKLATSKDKQEKEADNDNLDIFICTHKKMESNVVSNNVYKYVNCKYINNDTWNGIKGSFYSEIMSYFFIAEKYPLKDYVGFCHYRKYWAFLDDVPNVNEIFKNIELLVAKPLRFKRTIKEQYAYCHNIEDLYIVSGILAEKYPDYVKTWNKFLDGHIMFPYNMFIMRREEFLEYIKFMRDILDEFVNIIGKNIEKRIYDNVEKYLKDFSPNDELWYQYRIAGYLAERLTNAWILQNHQQIGTVGVEITEDKYAAQTSENDNGEKN